MKQVLFHKNDSKPPFETITPACGIIYGLLYLHIKNFEVKKLFIPLLILLLAACNTGRTFKKAEDAQDAGREFIRASLDGDDTKAEFYLFQDSTNRLLMNKWKKDYDRLDVDSKRKDYAN